MAATRKPRSPSVAGGDRHRFLRPGALAHLRDAKLRRRRAPSRLPPPSSPSLFPPRSPSAAGDGGGAMPHFLAAPRLLGPRCPQRKKLAAAKAVVFFLPPPPPSPERAVEAVLEFSNPPDMVIAAH